MRLCGLAAENAPTIFFSSCRKENGPRPGQKKRALSVANPRPGGLRFACIRELLVRNASGILRVSYRVRRTEFLESLRRRIWRLGIRLGWSRTICPSSPAAATLSPGRGIHCAAVSGFAAYGCGVPLAGKGEGPLPRPRLRGSFQRRGPQALPLAVLRGCGGNFGIPPRFSFGGVGRFLFSKEKAHHVSRAPESRCSFCAPF